MSWPERPPLGEPQPAWGVSKDPEPEPPSRWSRIAWIVLTILIILSLVIPWIAPYLTPRPTPEREGLQAVLEFTARLV